MKTKRRLAITPLVLAVLSTVTLQAMGETGRDQGAVIKSLPAVDEMLAWYDNRNARGVGAVTVAPTTAAPHGDPLKPAKVLSDKGGIIFWLNPR